MADKIPLEDYARLAEEGRAILNESESDPRVIMAQVYQLWWRWADFEILVIDPGLEVFSPSHLLEPQELPDSKEKEFVYPIRDFGYKLTTSKGEDLFKAGTSNCKLFYTIEKMIYLLVERLNAGGVSEETEVQVAFAGHELAQRKGFESIINLVRNIVVVNFEPGSWGERYLQTVKRMAAQGYGYPSRAPRDIFRQVHGPAGPGLKS